MTPHGLGLLKASFARTLPIVHVSVHLAGHDAAARCLVFGVISPLGKVFLVVDAADIATLLLLDGATSLKHIRGIGNDLQMDPGIGSCGKAGQFVPVGVGQPSLLIGGLTVGGSAT